MDTGDSLLLLRGIGSDKPLRRYLPPRIKKHVAEYGFFNSCEPNVGPAMAPPVWCLQKGIRV